MRKPNKVVVVSQHYPPDHSTTAAIMAAIAGRVAQDVEVVVVSGMPGSATEPVPGRPVVVEIRNWLLFTCRIFFALLRRLQRGDVALTVTAPFVLPYAVAAAARLKGAKSALILHDLFPDVLVTAGLLRPSSLVARAMRGINALMFRALNIVIVIGRDAEKLLLRYGGMRPDKIRFIPNWTTLTPCVRPVSPDNPFRKSIAARYVVGLSGNLGFTHDPDIVFEAARLLRDEADIHFLLSGWGIGFERLKEMQSATPLANVTLVERVADSDLDALLSSADVWLIPYRKDVAGVSVPSRFYNLLAAGRSVILVSEPEAEAALTVKENGLGWVVTPGRPDQLADAIRLASHSQDAAMAERAVAAARTFSPERALGGYAALVRELLCNRETERTA
jgi:colanic acid biosynthesis glycosyl transferase WcaI